MYKHSGGSKAPRRHPVTTHKAKNRQPKSGEFFNPPPKQEKRKKNSIRFNQGLRRKKTKKRI